MPIKLLIAENHELMRNTLKSVLGRMEDLNVIGLPTADPKIKLIPCHDLYYNGWSYFIAATISLGYIIIWIGVGV